MGVVFCVAVVATGGSSADAVRTWSAGGTPVALVTAETENEVIAVSLPSGRVLRRVHVTDPETVAATPSGQVAVVSPKGTVTLLDWRSLRLLAVLRDFRSPQIAAITPDGQWVYVTDAATGDLSVIELQTRRVVDRVFVGAGAHHLTISPNFQRAWVALGEAAKTIVVLNTSKANRPRVVGRIHTRVPAHDLAFSPNGRTVWVSSARAAYVSVLNADSSRTVATIPAGRGPQHIAFGPYTHPRAFITSGYSSTIETVSLATHKVIRRQSVAYGSFNLATAGGLVVTSSLLDGALTEFAGSNLHRLMDVKIAPAARHVTISVW
jgi:YVTN family beta-propeller protein